MICRVCGGRFERGELFAVYDDYPYGEGVTEQTAYYTCPDCGCADVHEECACAECGEEVPATELEEGLCRVCVADLTQTLEWMWGLLSASQKRWARETTEWMND